MKEKKIQEIMDLSGKTAIVTGGAMGIGYGIVYRLAEAGANVVIADINLESAEKASEKINNLGWKSLAVKLDVSNSSDVQNLIKTTIEKFGGIDILVNNAGIYPNIPILKMQENDFEKILSVNLKGAILCSKAVAEEFIKEKKSGKIINITSVDALHPSMTGLALYDSSKHGLWGFTKNFALELAPYKISVNAVAPGGIATPGTGMDKMTKELEEQMKPFLQKIPMQRLGEPDDIGKAVLFLASDLSSYMTGTQIVVDGGVLLA